MSVLGAHYRVLSGHFYMLVVSTWGSWAFHFIFDSVFSQAEPGQGPNGSGFEVQSSQLGPAASEVQGEDSRRLARFEALGMDTEEDRGCSGAGVGILGWTRLQGLKEEGLGAWSPRSEGGGAGIRTQKGPGTCLPPPAGQFGVGTESYFLLLRFLLFLNVLASVLKVCMTLLPTWLDGGPTDPSGPGPSLPCGFYNPRPQGLITFPSQLFNLLSGEVSAWGPLWETLSEGPDLRP